jgi:nitrous oxide reductase accessory protein NosL
MKKVTPLIGLAALFIAVWLAGVTTHAEDKPDSAATPCGYCGMDTSGSPTRITTVYSVKGKEPVEQDFLSLACYMRVAMIDPPKGSYTDVKILDTSTFKTKEPRFIPVENAWYVPVKSLSGSMPPYLASFALKKTAVKYAKAHDSRVLSYEAAHKLVMKEISG